MRIGYLIGALQTGGSERQLSELSMAMAAKGHRVEIVAYDGPGAFDDHVKRGGVAVRHMHGGSRLAKLQDVRMWAQTFRPDVMHGFMKRASSLAVLANLPGRERGVVASDFSTATYSRRQPALWGSLFLFGFAHRVVTQTEMNRRSLRLLAPWLVKKVRVVRNGVDTERFMPRRSVPGGAQFRFLCVGTVYRLKNPVRVVEAVRLLAERRKDFILDWVGKHGQGGRPSVDSARAMGLVQRHGLEPWVRFSGASERMEDVYPQYDGLVHVSIQDGIPNAVVEAMACGLPLVVSRVSDLPRIVEEGRNGFVCDEKDPASIADGMERLLERSGEERLAMGRRSRELAVRWFGMTRFADEYEALYREVLDGIAPESVVGGEEGVSGGSD